MLRILIGGGRVRVAAGRCVGAVIGAALLAVAAAVGIANCAPAWAGPPFRAGTTSARADIPIAASQAARHSGCTRRTGRGFAPTEHFARLKAWETVAQATGNWPFQTDEFRSTSYRCRPDRNGRLCVVAIEVCRKA